MKLTLMFIFKDEAPVLERYLNSLKNYVDHITAVDTGSTDQSYDIIQNYCKKYNLPCNIYKHPFVNFEDARNFALEKARMHGDYGFWMDCDEVFDTKLTKEQLKSELVKFDDGNAMVNYGNSRYARKCFINLKKPYYWKYPVHEILLCKEDVKTISLDVNIIVNTDGKSWSDDLRMKYYKHALAFQDYMAIHGEDPRCMFYLAQSYKDAGLNEMAIKYYRKRVLMDNGFYEEKYYSQLMISNLLIQTGADKKDIIDSFLKCAELDPLRSEHFLNLVLFLQTTNHKQLALVFSEYMQKYIGKLPYPQRLLFLDSAAYSEKIAEIHGHLLDSVSHIKKGIIIDVIIISYAKNNELKQTTERCIETLIESETDIKFNIIVVESNPLVSYNKADSVITPNEVFNYNKYINIGCKYAIGDYICACNNDLTFEKNWATNILQAKKLHDFDSASPFCPEFTPQTHKQWLVHYGYAVRQQLYGWCIFLTKQAYKKIGKFDEDVVFWYSDDIYAEQLKYHGLKHALVTSSHVHHHDKNLGKSASTILSEEKTNLYTNGQYEFFERAKLKYPNNLQNR